MTYYYQIHFSQISEILMQAAMGVSAVCGHKFAISDMAYALSDLSNKSLGGLKEPYYIAIREMGTECGFKEHCIKRCQYFGYPLVIAKIDAAKTWDFNMTIMPTHNWMDGDNNNMEQEFNSL